MMWRPAAVTVLGAVAMACSASPAAAERQVLTRHVTPREQQAERYQHLPFDVPPGTTRIVVSYRYDRRDGANVLDLGVFEPGPLTIGTAACRGWSGGERDTVTIAVDQATPGYWPGPIPAGRWHVVLGLYKVGETGVDVEILVDTFRDPVAAATLPLAPRPREPVRQGAGWYVGALHAHTNNSDGALAPQQLADKARAEKLDFLAITDHNNTVHQLSPVDAPGLLLIVGEEVTTPGGHFNVWGLGGDRSFVDFRVPGGDPAIDALVAAARARGALVSINHPASACAACTWTHAVPDGVNAIEISDERQESRLQALAMWDVLLRQGRRLTAVGTSDWHRGAAPLGLPSVRVWAEELSTAAILEGIRLGRVIVVADPSLPAPDLTARTGHGDARVGDLLHVPRGDPVRVELRGAPPGTRVDLLWNGEPIAEATVPADGAVTFNRHPAARGYVRIHLTRPDGTLLAVTNPIFIEVTTP
jgi:hypothetical protein